MSMCSFFKNPEFARLYKNEYGKKKGATGWDNLTKSIERSISEKKISRSRFPKATIAGFELTLFPDVKIESTFNPESCGTSVSGWEDITGYGGVAGKAEWSISYKGLTPTAVPIPYFVKGALGMEFDAMLNINSLIDHPLNGAIATKPYISGTVGAGLDGLIAVEGTAKGGVDSGWEYPASSFANALKSCTAYLSITGRAYALMLEYQLPTKKWDISCMPSTAKSTLSALMSLSPS